MQITEANNFSIGKNEKLIPNLNLKLYLELPLKFKNIHRVLESLVLKNSIRIFKQFS